MHESHKRLQAEQKLSQAQMSGIYDDAFMSEKQDLESYIQSAAKTRFLG